MNKDNNFKDKDFRDYYREERNYLRELGKEFSDLNPELAKFLSKEGSDPDVERVLDGVAFLTGNIRQKIDDEFPEIIQGLMHLLWPHYLRPIPAVSMLQFEPIEGMVNDIQKIKRGTEVTSVVVENTRCRFRTCYDIDLLPFTVKTAEIFTPVGALNQLRIKFSPVGDVQFSQLFFSEITIHLFGAPGYALYLWLCRRVENISITYKIKTKSGEDRPDAQIPLEPSSCIEPVGFSKDEALIPYPLASFEGYRLLQEYFTFPAKFLFIRLKGLERINREEIDKDFEIIFEFNKPFPESIRVTSEHIRLNCTPVVNIFPMDADPIRVDHNKTEYRLKPADVNPDYFQIYSVDTVTSRVKGSAGEQRYEYFYSFRHDIALLEKRIYYTTHIREAAFGHNMYLSFVNSDNNYVVPPAETVSTNLTCINLKLNKELRVGDICEPTDSSPEFARFSNITHVKPEVLYPFGKKLYWRLLSHISLNYVSIADVKALRAILSLYNFQGVYDTQAARENEHRLQGIRGIKQQKINRMFQGAPVSGLRIELYLREENFEQEGDLFLFASIISEFLSLYASINSFTELIVRETKTNKVYQWTPKIVKQKIL